MVSKSESYNLGLNKKDTTIQGIKLKPITKIEAFKHSVKKNYGWTKYGIKVVEPSDGLPIRYGDTSIHFFVMMIVVFYLRMEKKEIVLDQHLIIG